MGAPLIYRSSGFEPDLRRDPDMPALELVQGDFVAHHSLLRQLFGEPTVGVYGGRYVCEWALRFSDGMRAIVAGYGRGVYFEACTEWQICGTGSDVRDRVLEILRPLINVKDTA